MIYFSFLWVHTGWFIFGFLPVGSNEWKEPWISALIAEEKCSDPFYKRCIEIRSQQAWVAYGSPCRSDCLCWLLWISYCTDLNAIFSFNIVFRRPFNFFNNIFVLRAMLSFTKESFCRERWQIFTFKSIDLFPYFIADYCWLAPAADGAVIVIDYCCYWIPWCF